MNAKEIANIRQGGAGTLVAWVFCGFFAVAAILCFAEKYVTDREPVENRLCPIARN